MLGSSFYFVRFVLLLYRCFLSVLCFLMMSCIFDSVFIVVVIVVVVVNIPVSFASQLCFFCLSQSLLLVVATGLLFLRLLALVFLLLLFWFCFWFCFMFLFWLHVFALDLIIS